jgi:hypothetical protein
MNGTSGDGGSGGFGAGGGGAGFDTPGSGKAGANGAGGFGGGAGGASSSGSFGGGGAGLGGALFVRSGNVSIRNSTFGNNLVAGGENGGTPAVDGLAKGGAIFALDDLEANANGNDRGMPASLPRVTGCNNEFFQNTVTPFPPGTDTDNSDTFGVSRERLTADCSESEPVPVVGTFGMWLLGTLLAALGLFGLKRRR